VRSGLGRVVGRRHTDRRSRRLARRREARWRRIATASGLLGGYLLDAALGDPRRLHPVAGFGTAAAALERRMYQPTRAAGARYAAVAVGVPVLAATALSLATRRRPVIRAALVALTTWTVLGGRSLHRQAGALARSLQAGDLDAARRRLPNLAGRDPSALDERELARATVESVAENTSDAVVAPLFWGAVAGLPGLVGYRAVNTLDAMVGHRTLRYAEFGTAAARADDVANLVPSRLTALAFVAGAPLVGGSRRQASWIWFRDGHRHPSPNAGQCEAAMAGALDVRLGGRNVYFGQAEDRPTLGDGRPPEATDIYRAVRLSAAASGMAVAVAVLRALSGPWRRLIRRRRASG
jgi:adenosylcobinamide-phosphate synthase